jgi:outer membrane receptor protein involved in Fe transport
MNFIKTFRMAIFLGIILPTSISFAQRSDTLYKSIISGSVLDETTKQPLANVNILLLNTMYGAATDQEGRFVIENVPIGRYSITARIIGYEQQSVADITVLPKRTTTVNFELELKPIETTELIVQPDFFSTIDNFSKSSIAQIDNKEIRKTPGVPDMFRRLQSIAGIVRATDYSPALVARGGDPEENLTLFENIEIYSPFHFSNLGGTVMSDGMSIIEPRLIQCVTLSTGGFSIKYGDRLSSVTQIYLLEPERRRINGDVSVDMGGFSAFFSGPLESKTSWMVAGRRGIWDMFMEMQGKDYHPKTIDVHAKFIYKLAPNHNLIISGLYVNDEYWRIKKDDDLDAIDEKKFRNITKDMTAWGINYRWLFSENGYLLVTPYLNLNNWRMNEGPLDNKNGFGYTNKENIFGTKAEVTYRFSNVHTFLFGGEYKSVNVEYSKWSAPDTLRTGEVIALYSIFFGPETSYKAGQFIQYSFRPVSWIEVNAGLRNDYFDYTKNHVLATRFGATFDISEEIKVNAAYGSYAQFPQFYKIFLYPANNTLKTSMATHYILGMEYLPISDLQIKIEAFYKDFENLPITENDTSKLYVSSGSGYAQGMELTLTKKMSSNFYLLANYTFSSSKRKDQFHPSYYDFKYDSPNTMNVMASYKLSNWWEVSLTYRFASGLPYTPYDISSRSQIGNFWYCARGIINSERLPNYQRLDLRIDRRFIFESWNLSLFLEIWNFTDHSNIVMYEYNSDFTKREAIHSMFSFMPMFGVAAEF